ncbi:hypothetical protein [Nigerium massiliense]|uniref:hypothetical protein n=1 Tax=Nigerium massiliense TaxID=1522317 RepID=UPI00069332A1|nr:hypothetical protein [Nigerium massiliense]
MIWFSAALLVAGVLAYGIAGGKLHSGSSDEGGALRSRDWWTGTVLQAAGFLFTLFARRSLPLLIVQAVSAASLVVTVVYQHVTGARKMTARMVGQIALVVVCLGLIASATLPGPSVALAPAHLWLLGIGVVVSGALWAVRMPAIVSGAVAGWGYSIGAIGARLVMGDAAHPPWIFWELPWQSWLAGVLTVGSIVLGQAHVTRALGHAEAAPVLAAMYLVEICVPAAVGIALLGESPRPGFGWAMVVGGAGALIGTFGLAFSMHDPATKDADAEAPPAVRVDHG